ncbi:hypothetical protein Ancab_033406 [Ancistrocladus abbreviatus]
MEDKKRLFRLASVLLVLWFIPASAASCPLDTDGRDCEDCIVHQMKYDCPSCVRMRPCMAKCLWGGMSWLREVGVASFHDYWAARSVPINASVAALHWSLSPS